MFVKCDGEMHCFCRISLELYQRTVIRENIAIKKVKKYDLIIISTMHAQILNSKPSPSRRDRAIPLSPE